MNVSEEDKRSGAGGSENHRDFQEIWTMELSCRAGGWGGDMVISTQDDCQRDDNLEPLAQPWVKCQPLIFTTNRGGGGVVIVT